MALSILILGGMTHLARPLLAFLTQDNPLTQSNQISHIRVVDKFLIDSSGSGTTYVDPPTKEALKDARVEYKQANLNIESTATTMFKPPSEVASSYDLVFDLTGDGIISSDVPAQLLLERTARLAGMIAKLSASTGVKALVRDSPPFMTSKNEDGLVVEGEMSKKKIKTRRAYWWYEAERAAANVDGVPLVILRSANIWGGFQYIGAAMPRLILAQIYEISNEPLEMLWGPNLKSYTLHARDWSEAAFQSALWMVSKGKEAALSEAGEELPPLTLTAKESKKKREGEVEMEKDHEGCCPRSKTPKAVVFNVVDDGETTQGIAGEICSEVFHIKTGFVNAAINAYAKLNFDSVVDDINEKHIAMTDSLLRQANYTAYTPLTAYIDPELLMNRAVALDGSKIKKVVGWKPKIPFNAEGVKKCRDELANDGVWLTPEAFAAAVKAAKENGAQ